ncbi:MAG TPA: GGDEF domain-containing protein [Caulobacteraceae bacterium]|nr:GGDEF domain-containing protein [Caulobacteraceae bacterium]
MLRDKRGTFLATAAPGPLEIRVASIAAVTTLVMFAVFAPFARRQLAALPALVPAYEAWTILSLVVTAALLLGQLAMLRSRGLLVLVSGYFFTAFAAALHVLIDPVSFGVGPLLGASPEAAGWMSLIWHGGFPAFVIAYALLDRSAASQFAEGGDAGSTRGMTRLSLIGAGAGLAAAAALLAIVIVSAPFAPSLADGHGQISGFGHGAVMVECGLCLVAIAALCSRRSRTLLDLWLIVSMVAWLFDLTLAGLLDAGRYDLGWYAGRLYGAFASCALLVALLVESARHYTRLSELYEALTVSNRALEHLSLHDGLTGLPNRRYFDTYLGRQSALMRRHDRSLALVLCDVDSFKAYNDTYGHQAGDECLTRIAMALRSCCRRPADMAARYGGEEFALILPETDLDGALRMAEAAREAVARLRIPHAAGLARPYVTFSGGVAVMEAGAVVTIAQLLATADEGLFQAKRHGRNCIVAAAVRSGPTGEISRTGEPQMSGEPQAAA